jgi:hypothetical protein
MHSSIAASITKLKEDLKQEMTTQLESVISMIYTKLHIPADPPLSDPPFHTETETFSHSHNFHPHQFQCDLRLPWVDVTKFNGSDPTSCVTEMEHYFSFYDISNDLSKLWYGVLHLDQQSKLICFSENPQLVLFRRRRFESETGFIIRTNRSDDESCFGFETSTTK